MDEWTVQTYLPGSYVHAIPCDGPVNKPEPAPALLASDFRPHFPIASWRKYPKPHTITTISMHIHTTTASPLQHPLQVPDKPARPSLWSVSRASPGSGCRVWSSPLRSGERSRLEEGGQGTGGPGRGKGGSRLDHQLQHCPSRAFAHPTGRQSTNQTLALPCPVVLGGRKREKEERVPQ